MRHVSQETRNLLKDLPPQFAKPIGLAPLYRTFIEAVRVTWSDNPAAADYMLHRVNAVYLRTEQPKGGRLRDKPTTLFEVMLSDAMSRSELNARRESLKLQLALRGIACDELRIGASKRGMLQRHPLEPLLELKEPAPAAPAKKGPAPVSSAEAMAVLRRACVVVFEADALALAPQITSVEVKAAAMPTLSKANKNARSCWQWYFCDAAVSTAAAQKKLSASEEALRDKCFQLGLPLRKLSFRLQP